MSEEQGLTPYETREILFYKTENGEVRVEILLFQENLWLTQAKMAELFEVQKAAISKHLKNIFESGELSEDSVVSKMETTAADGKRYQTNYYNLDAIIAVGYRVNSKKATMFRIWANRVLKEFIIKGYVMDDARLREPENFFGKDYFEEQLERIRDIRASERRFYQKITDIYSQCSADYDVESPITKEFFATVQNKLHYAVTHHTAAEIVFRRNVAGVFAHIGREARAVRAQTVRAAAEHQVGAAFPRGDALKESHGAAGLQLDPDAGALLKFLEDWLVDRFLVRGENDQTVPLSGREGGDVLCVRAAAAGEQKQADEQQTAAAHNGHPS